MEVLNLVTNEDSQFYQSQVETLERRGVECTTLSVPGKNYSESMVAGENGRRSMVDYLKFYPNVLAESFGSYELIHANYGLTAPMAIAQPRLPVVVSLWGSDLMGQYGPLTEYVVRFADAVIVMSEEMATQLDRESYVIPHGIDMDAFSPMDRSTARSALDWPDDELVVLFPYPPKREVKDYPRAERIFEAVEDRMDRPLSLRTVTGVPHDEMPYYMNAADVLLLTSKREGSPNTVKEAMATNLPVVATDVGDVADRLADVEPAVVSDDDLKLVNGLEDVLRRGDRSNGREAIRNLGLERMGERIHDVYRSVVEH